MSASQRTKGASYEREVCAAFSEALGRKIQRNIGQARDGGNDIDVGFLRIECKRRKTLGTFERWMKQAEDSCSLAQLPCVVMRSDNGESYISFKLEDFLREFGDATGLGV